MVSCAPFIHQLWKLKVVNSVMYVKITSAISRTSSRQFAPQHASSSTHNRRAKNSPGALSHTNAGDSVDLHPYRVISKGDSASMAVF